MNDLPPASPQATVPKTSGLAITSLVLGIFAVCLFCISPLFALPAIICGHIAASKIGRSAGVLKGKGLAIAGFSTGYVGLALFLIIVPMAVPYFTKVKDMALRAACDVQLQQIQAAKNKWAMDNQKGQDAVPTPADLDKYLPRGFTTIKCPKGGAYSINTVGSNATCSIPGHHILQPGETP